MPVGAPASAGQVLPPSGGQPASGALTASHRPSTRVAPSPHGCSESTWMHAPRAAVAAIAENHWRGNAVFVMSELDGFRWDRAAMPVRKQSSRPTRCSETRSVSLTSSRAPWNRQAPAQSQLKQEGRHSESRRCLREFADLSPAPLCAAWVSANPQGRGESMGERHLAGSGGRWAWGSRDPPPVRRRTLDPRRTSSTIRVSATSARRGWQRASSPAARWTRIPSRA
jgi:hypothetical protein